MTAAAGRKGTLVVLFTMILAACGGGGGSNSSSTPSPPPSPGGSSSGGSTSPNPPTPDAEPGGPTDAQRTRAAEDTARNHARCTAIRPFYWEVGDSAGSKASGSVGGTTYTADKEIHFASASKWVYGAYVVELRNGALTDTDVKHLNFTSGYGSMAPLSCGSASTVDVCLNLGTNGLYTPATDGRFFYNGGHMQRHAHDIGLGGMNSGELAFEVQRLIGDFGFTYASPQPPGGLFGTPSAYAGFLRKMLAKEGMTTDDVEVVEMAPADMPAALYVKGVDAYCTGEPFGAAAQRAGYARPLTMTRDEWPRYMCCVLTVREELIATNRPLVQNMVNYVLAAGMWLDGQRKNRETAIQIAAKRDYFNQDPAILRFVMDNPEDRVTYGDLKMIPSEFDDLMNQAVEAGTLRNRVAYAKYVDESFARAARPASIAL